MTRSVKRMAQAAFVAAIAAVGAACASPSAPSKNVPFSATDVRVGTGAVAGVGSTVSVAYTGWLYDGTRPENKGSQFDASPVDRPFVFWLGTGQVIPGWDQGMVGMRVGGMRRLVVPASLGYGRTGAGTSIPPNATLVFDIELLGVF